MYCRGFLETEDPDDGGEDAGPFLFFGQQQRVRDPILFQKNNLVMITTTKQHDKQRIYTNIINYNYITRTLVSM